MKMFEVELNEALTTTFRSVLKVEELAIKHYSDVELTINETHIIEMIGKNQEENITMSGLAGELCITLPSVTVAVNKLEKKGYVNKVKSEEDARRIHVELTRKGKRIFNAHNFFHLKMIKNISGEFSKDEKEILLSAIIKLNKFFNEKIRKLEA